MEPNMALKDALKLALHGALDPLLAAGVRKSMLEEEEEKKLAKPGDLSITRYLMGAVSQNWRGASAEKALYDEAAKAMTSLTGAGGGILVHPQISNQVIQLLRAKALVRKLNPTVVNLPTTNTLQMPRIDSGTTAHWVMESEHKPDSEPTLGELELQLKEVAALCKIPNALLEDSTPAADQIVTLDLATVLALAEDLALIQGTGGAQPLGIYNWPGIGATVLTLPVTFDDLLNAMTAIETLNGKYASWVMHPRSKNTLRQLKDAEGRYIWMQGNVLKEEPDILLGLPCYYTTQIPTNLTFGGLVNTSYIILGDWADYVIIQKRAGIEMTPSSEAGDAFEHNQTWFRAVRRVDGGPRYVQDFHIIQGVA